MLVSVILTSFNYGRYLKNTIKSVVNQTFKDWELIIVDDCSTDNSADIIMEFADKDKRIKFIGNNENLGLTAAVKTGLLAASGEWAAFLESDDLWRNDYLEKKLAVAEKYPECGLIYNDVVFFDKNAPEAAKKYEQIIRKNRSWKFPKNMFYNFGYENPILTMSSVMIKKNVLEGQSFNPPVDKLFDWYLYILTAKATDFYYLNEPLTLWRQHPESYLRREGGVKFRLANISAYLAVLKQEPLNLKLLLFTVIAFILMCFKRLKVYLR